MTDSELLHHCRSLGVEFAVIDGALRLRRTEKLPPDIRGEVRVRQASLAQLIQRGPEIDVRHADPQGPTPPLVNSDAEPVRQNSIWTQCDGILSVEVVWVQDLDTLRAHPELLAEDEPVFLLSERERLLDCSAIERSSWYARRLREQREGTFPK